MYFMNVVFSSDGIAMIPNCDILPSLRFLNIRVFSFKQNSRNGSEEYTRV